MIKGEELKNKYILNKIWEYECNTIEFLTNNKNPIKIIYYQDYIMYLFGVDEVELIQYWNGEFF